MIVHGKLFKSEEGNLSLMSSKMDGFMVDTITIFYFRNVFISVPVLKCFSSFICLILFDDDFDDFTLNRTIKYHLLNSSDNY